MLKARLITDKDEKAEKIVRKLQKLFPEKVGYGDWDVWDNLQNPNNINIVAEEDGKSIGYILCIPQEEAYRYLKELDPQISNDPKMCYVDQICITEEKRDGKAFIFLIKELEKEALKRGYVKWSSHLMRGMETVLRRMYAGKIISERETKMPAYGNHDLVYMEGWI
jgi:hypothetical protein